MRHYFPLSKGFGLEYDTYRDYVPLTRANIVVIYVIRENINEANLMGSA
jgi:hypothetical protein